MRHYTIDIFNITYCFLTSIILAESAIIVLRKHSAEIMLPKAVIFKTKRAARKRRNGDYIMKEISHKVVILNKLESPYISEAIIILKNGCAVPQSKAVEEAERIVRSYLDRAKKNGQSVKTARNFSKKATAAMCAAAALLSFIVSLIIFR